MSRPMMLAIVRVTASISALLKFKVTGSRVGGRPGGLGDCPGACVQAIARSRPIKERSRRSDMRFIPG